MDTAIIEYLRQNFSLRVGPQMAEQIKLEIGSAYPLPSELAAEVRGLDTVSGIPRRATVTSEEIRDALREPLTAIIACCRSVIERCDPELVSDLADTGLMLTGGGALLRGLDELMREQLGIPVQIADDPLTTVARGTSVCLEHLEHWRDSLETEHSVF
jgi:rod shape-determining protein MreB